MRFDRALGSLLALFSVLTVSCATKQTAPAELVVFPPPPDTARIQFLTRFADSDDVAKGRSLLQTLIGDPVDEVRQIIKPFGVAIRDGKIYVCDTVYRGVDILDLQRGTFEYFRPPDFPGRMNTPVNCAVDSQSGWLYVADTGRRAVLIFDESLDYVDSIVGDEDFRPNDVFVEPSLVWVTDGGSGKIKVYEKSTLRELRAFPDIAPGQPGHLRRPTNLYVTGDRVYATDFSAFSVKVYTRDGQFVTSVGSHGDGLGQFARPKGIAVDSASILYVVDAAFANIQAFDPDGQLLMFFGGNYGGPGAMLLPAQVTIDYDNLSHFERYVHEGFELKYLILVTNQYGPDKVSVYGFVEPKLDTILVR
jgi:DNA-binding beta-propeller fold protein YncE